MLAESLAAFARIVSGTRPRWVGIAPDRRQRVYYANHTSHLDALVIWAVLPPDIRRRTRPVAARDYWMGGRIRRHLATKVFNAVLVDRAPADYHHSPLDDMVAALEEGSSLILFPEGQRGTGTEVKDFRAGLYHLAERRPDVELVPVYLTNLNRVMPRGAHLPVPLQSEAIFGAPLFLEPGESKSAFLVRSRNALMSLRAP
jgi:1-acyl-sn-glycerol-3-phosphate acyltransferase